MNDNTLPDIKVEILDDENDGISVALRHKNPCGEYIDSTFKIALPFSAANKLIIKLEKAIKYYLESDQDEPPKPFDPEDYVMGGIKTD